jgi:hypothetical protein
MKIVRKILNLRNLFVLALIVGAVLVFRSWRASVEADVERELGVTIIVSPSVQPVQGQALLFKATNISMTPVGIRLHLYNDRERFPVEIKDFPTIAGGMTVTHLYNSPPAKFAMNGTTFEVPDAVRAVVGPMAGGEPAAVRRVVANLQLMSLQPAGADATSASLDAPIIVPLERCLFTPRGYLPGYTDGRLFWECGPPVQED